MHILISNDDGLHATGIRHLSEQIRAQVDRVTLVAPDRDRSGASNSLTLDSPIRVEKRDDGVFKVYGTPTDCVHIGITGLLDDEPDMVISGINAGANMGDDVLYSGTVAAAMEGRFLGLPAMAVSLAYENGRPTHFESGARAARILMNRLIEEPLPADTILNVNLPDLPWHEIRIRNHPAGSSSSIRERHPDRGSARTAVLLDRRRRRRRGQRAGDRFQRGAPRFRVGHADSR